MTDRLAVAVYESLAADAAHNARSHRAARGFLAVTGDRDQAVALYVLATLDRVTSWGVDGPALRGFMAYHLDNLDAWLDRPLVEEG